jgi:beta-phosphoglucomutase-like phosphatase (HAD superfamily)
MFFSRFDSKKAAIVRFEEAVIEGGPIALPGAKALLAQIEAGSSPSARGWTIVTSGMSPVSSIYTIYIYLDYPLPPPKKKKKKIATNVYTPKALSRTGIQSPAAGYVTSDDVKGGKPMPDPYLAGAERVGVDPKNCT